ncbi:unnamed protein product [Kuraishia capsulata CBS 1993]|uniref:Glycosyltransferase family 15 protein n=1 Tax=Kuraishia capsulata CBS 1993 TaxID=1382522 RepID=W6MRW3_9ASCO|nr:uncharacterized protein KUCA_T00000526001 [Kuraishia capsulata CBS 1993]CDK24560.1 unnamed protein product [Kuraishia capsulata CBS 1993]
MSEEDQSPFIAHQSDSSVYRAHYRDRSKQLSLKSSGRRGFRKFFQPRSIRPGILLALTGILTLLSTLGTLWTVYRYPDEVKDLGNRIANLHDSAWQSVRVTFHGLLIGEMPDNDDQAQEMPINELHGRENATLLSLVRNSELDGILQSIESLEERFNHRFNYDWIFMNDQPFEADFIEKVSRAVSGRALFTKVPEEYWSYPENIDLERAERSRQQLKAKDVMYADSESYRFMCRFNSGFFYKMRVMRHYKYYWRVEPGVKFSCDIPYDVFTEMRTQDKKYGFTMAMSEDMATIPTLWAKTKQFFSENTDLVDPNFDLNFISDDGGENYNKCHFWTNFEIADLDFFRSEQYEKYFQFLENEGGFFYERWGDAPVHTLALSYLLPPSALHYFDNTGYYHKPNQACPPSDAARKKFNCDCNPRKDFVWHKWSCVSRFFDVFQLEIPEGVKLRTGKRDLGEMSDDQFPIWDDGSRSMSMLNGTEVRMVLYGDVNGLNEM